MPEDLQPNSHCDDGDKVKLLCEKLEGLYGDGVCFAYLHATIASCKRRNEALVQMLNPIRVSLRTSNQLLTCQSYVFVPSNCILYRGESSLGLRDSSLRKLQHCELTQMHATIPVLPCRRATQGTTSSTYGSVPATDTSHEALIRYQRAKWIQIWKDAIL